MHTKDYHKSIASKSEDELLDLSKLKKSYIFYAVLTICMSTLIIYLYFQSAYHSAEYRIEEDTKNVFNLLEVNLKAKLTTVMKDVKILANSKQIKDLVSNNYEIQNKQDVNELFKVYEKYSGLYDQIRYIDIDGREICRVNFNKGNIDISSEDKLQNKKHRYYFQKSIPLNKGEFFISPLDLNKEYGKIEVPYKPMLRIATPVFDENNKRKGILILNYLAGNMLRAFQKLAGKSNGDVMLLNQDGYILSAKNKSKEFAFMFLSKKQKPEYIVQIPREVRDGSTQKIYQSYNTQGDLVTIKQLKVAQLLGLKGNGDKKIACPHCWFIYSKLSQVQIAEVMAKLKEVLLIAFIIIFFITVVGFYLRYSMMKKTIELKKINSDMVETFGKRMKEQYDYLQYLLDALPFPFYVIDTKNYQITLANKVLKNLQLNKSTCYELTHNTDTPCSTQDHKCPLKIVKETGKPVQLEHKHIMPNGSFGYFLVHGIPIFNKEGKLTQMIEFSINIDDRKRVELALKDAKQKADEANQAKSSFLAMMSHEIRTPMNGVLGMAELLADTDLRSEQRDYIDTIRVSAESLLKIINDILDFSKIEANKVELEERPVYIPRLIESVYELLAPKAAEKNIELLYIIDADVPATILGDEVRLRQIMINLANNSLKFTEKGEILIEVSRAAREKDSEDKKRIGIQFAVKDTGVGISEENLHKLFQAFSQEDASTTRKYGGTGLGLAISKRLVTMMNGRIWVETEKGVGSTFFFTIKTKIAKTSISMVHTKQIPSFMNKKILLVDDNATNRKILSLQLSSLGMKVTTASSAAEAEKLILEDKQKYSLVIMDHSMPGKSGVEATKTIRNSGFDKDKLPVILLSSIDLSVKENAEIFNKLLTKPLKQVLLLEALNELLGVADDMSKNIDFNSHKNQKKHLLSNPGKILLAEDNKINQKIALKILEKMGCTDIDVAEDGKQALKMALKNKYQFIFMDMQMPEMDGIEVTSEIRKQNTDIIIIAMTANAMLEDKEACLKSGMNDYITKPISMNNIVKVVNKYLKS